MALTTKKKWGLGTAVSGAVFIVVGILAFAGKEVGYAQQIVLFVGLILEGVGFRFVAPGVPPEDIPPAE